MNKQTVVQKSGGTVNNKYSNATERACIPVKLTCSYLRRRQACANQRCRNKNNLIYVSTDTEAHNTVLRFSYMNIGSLKNKTIGLHDYILDKKLDVLVLTETWLFKDEQENLIYRAELLPNNYTIMHVPRTNGQTGGGIAVIYRDNFTIHFTNSSNTHENAFNQFEFLDCKLEKTRTKNGRFLRILVVYRPPPTRKNGLKLKSFWKQWTEFLSTVASSHSECIITGDLNFHLDNHEDSSTKRFRRVLDEFGMTQLVTESTHTAGHILDVLITPTDNSMIILSSVCVHDPCISDNQGQLTNTRHFAVMWSTVFERIPNRKRKEIEYQDFKNIDSDSFSADLQDLKLGQKCSQDLSVDDMLALIDTEVGDVITKHAPLVKKLVLQRPNQPWYNDQLKHLKARRRQCERKYRKSMLEIDRQQYRNACNIYNNTLCKTRIAYDQGQITACEQDKGKLFAITSSLMGSKSKKILPSCSGDETSTAEAFVQFFHKKVALITENLDQALLEQPNDLPPTSRLKYMCKLKNVPKLCDYRLTTASEVKDIILSSNNKYCILDPMPTWFLKRNIDVLIPAIVTLFNKSLSSGIVPKAFKNAVLSPQIKDFNLDPEDLNNYRPISNLPFLAKVLEKIVYSRLDQHLSQNDLLAKHQSAYRKGHSTETLLLRMNNDILTSIDKGNAVLLVTIDISAAFDTVNHCMLLKRYENYFGIEGTALQWMVSYLTERQHSVKIGKGRSTTRSMNCGFPQGSVLGGLKFNMFSAPVQELVDLHHLDSKFFADDSNVYKSFNIKNGSVLPISEIENCLNDICHWMLQNRMKMNSDKTKVILFLPKGQMRCFPLQSVEIKVGPDVVYPVVKIKSLGVDFDSTLTMEQFVNKKTSSAWFELRKLSRIRKKINRKVTETLVNALITSKLDYCNSLLCKLPQKTIKKLQRVQHAAAKIVFKARKYDHVTPLLKQLHWLPVKVRSSFKLLMLTYKALHGKAPDYLTELLNYWNLRSSSIVTLRTVVSAPKTRYGHRAFIHLAPMLWNALPYDIRAAETLNIFKTKLKSYYFNQCYNQ